jgi:hypothetical protein
MADFIPKPGKASAFKVPVKQEDWHADFTGKVIIPADIVPGETYHFGLTKKQKSDGEVFVEFRLGNKFTPKNEERAKPVAEGADDLSDVPF